MPDVVDLILDRLTPSSVDLLEKLDIDSNRTSRDVSDALQKSLNEMESIYLNGCAHELNDKTELLVGKTRKHKLSLENYTSQFEKLKCSEKHPDHSQKIKVYDQQIENLEKQLRDLIQESGATEPESIFLQTDETFKQIEELEMKTKEIKERLKYYKDFPATLREAQYCISDAKERIKEKENLLDTLFRGRKNID